jgi:LPXTG-site transpeptidase (sortase) family protein
MSKKWILISLGCLIGVILVLNGGYFYKQIEYYSDPPTRVTIPNEPDEKIQPNILIVESLGIEAPVVYVEEESEKVFQEGLQNGVVHYPKTAHIGQSGNAYIFGHSSDYLWSKGNYKTVFALLPKIELGATIIASDASGNPYRYKVMEKFAVDADDFSVLDQFNNEKKLLTLQTSYPVGTALRRFIVRSELIE